MIKMFTNTPQLYTYIMVHSYIYIYIYIWYIPVVALGGPRGPFNSIMSVLDQGPPVAYE